MTFEQREQLDALLVAGEGGGPAHSTGCAMVRICSGAQ